VATKVSIKRTGYAMSEATITEWLKKEGEKVKQGEPLATVETEKVNVEITSPASGILRKITVPEGKVARVGQTIAIIAREDEDIEQLLKESSLEELEEKKTEEVVPEKKEEIVPLTGRRKRIAENMLQSKRTSAHATTFNEANVEKVLDFLKQKDKKVSFTSFLVKAVASTLKQFPSVNCSLKEDKIIIKRYYHIGVAVDTEEGLIVPVVKDADKKNLSQISQDIARLVSRAKEGTLSPDDVRGGTFTISNAGMYGSLFFTPIINQPQAAILGVGRIARRAVVVREKVEVKPMVYLCLSYDHRIIDGALAQQFLDKVRENIERGANGLT